MKSLGRERVIFLQREASFYQFLQLTKTSQTTIPGSSRSDETDF